MSPSQSTPGIFQVITHFDLSAGRERRVTWPYRRSRAALPEVGSSAAAKMLLSKIQEEHRPLEVYDRRIRAIDDFMAAQFATDGGIFADLIVSLDLAELRKWKERGLLTLEAVTRMISEAEERHIVTPSEARLLLTNLL